MDKNKSRKKILMIAHFTSFPTEGSNSRFIYILNRLDPKKAEAELITSDFYHSKKEHRVVSEIQKSCTHFKTTLIHEPKYKKNVSIQRFLSHKILARNIRRYLQNKIEQPDAIYCAIPSLAVAKVATKYAKRNHIKLIIDIQDLWPEAFEMVLNIPFLSNLLFYPMNKQADFIYKNADEIIGVSKTYVDRALRVSPLKNGLSVFLGTDLQRFDQIPPTSNRKNGVTLVYIGTLGSSYDLKSTIDALVILKKRGITDLNFLIMGDGPYRKKMENYAAQKDVNCTFTGNLNYEVMVARLKMADVAINPIRNGAAASIINKVGDYAAANLPVVNTQECPEYRNLLDDNNAGINCPLKYSALDIADAIQKLYSNPNLRKAQGKNDRRIAEQKFDRDHTYKNIIKIIEKTLTTC